MFQAIRLESEIALKVPNPIMLVEHEAEFMRVNQHLPLLPMTVDEGQLRYHTGGLKTLDELLKQVILTDSLFRTILYNISHAINNLKHYLLDENRLLLNPTLICVDHQYNIFLSYLPLNHDVDREYSFSHLISTLIDLQVLIQPDVRYEDLRQAVNHPYFSSQLLINMLKDDDVEVKVNKKVPILPIAIGAIGILTVTFTIVYFKFIKYIWISGLLTIGLVIYFLLNYKKDEESVNTEGTQLIQIKQVTRLVHLKSQQELVMENNIIKIGRAKKGQHPLKSKSISKEHALIEEKQQGFFLEDLHSTNGTFLNGEKIHPKLKYRVKNGDEITFAQEIFRFTSS